MSINPKQYDPNNWQRPRFEDISKPDIIEKFKCFNWIGNGTEPVLLPFIVNFAGLIYDGKHKLIPIEQNGMKIDDKGLKPRRFGGWRGSYRCFEISESSGYAETVSIAVIGTQPTQSESKRKRNTLLIVAIDDRDYPTLELSLDKFCCRYGTGYKIWHNGRMRIKDVKVTKDQVLAYVRQHAPELRRVKGFEDRIELGTLDNSSAISWEQNETTDFFGNLIKYALIRDEFKKTKKLRYN